MVKKDLTQIKSIFQDLAFEISFLRKNLFESTGSLRTLHEIIEVLRLYPEFVDQDEEE